MEKNNNTVEEESRDYPAAALFLAKSYENMLKEKEYNDKVLSGELVYTTEMAIADLTKVTATMGSETGVRVQTSNTSKQPERIAILLDEGYVEKRNRELYGSVINDVEGREYLAWKLSVIETAMQERMDAMERAVFKRLFLKHMTYQQIRDAYHKKTLHNFMISASRGSALEMIAKELALRDGAFEDGRIYTDKLMQEIKEDEAYGDGG